MEKSHYIDLNGKPINLCWLFTISSMLEGSDLKVKFDYNANKFQYAYGFILYEPGYVEHQIEFDNKPEAQKWYAFVLKKMLKKSEIN